MENKKLNDQDLIALMGVYLNEYSFRNNLSWSQLFKFYFAIIIVITLPFIAGYTNVDFSFLPRILFHVVGFIMTLAFLHQGISRFKRLEASTETYNNIIKKLEPEYQRKNIDKLKLGKWFKGRNSYQLLYLMVFSLLAVNVILFIFKN